MFFYTNYLFFLILGTLILYLSPDRDEILIGLLILIIVSLLVETVGKNLTAMLDEERKKLKLKFDIYFRLKRRINLDNLQALNESIAFYFKYGVFLEEYIDQDFSRNVFFDVQQKLLAHTFKKNYRDFTDHREIVNQTMEEAESLVRLKIIADFKQSMEKNGT